MLGQLRLPGQLIGALLLAVGVSADVQPSNSTVAGTSGARWALTNEDNTNMTSVVPITEVASRSVSDSVARCVTLIDPVQLTANLK